VRGVRAEIARAVRQHLRQAEDGLLLWVYYSAQVFLLGAEFTRAWAGLEGSKRDAPAGPRVEAPAGRPAEDAAAH